MKATIYKLGITNVLLVLSLVIYFSFLFHLHNREVEELRDLSNSLSQLTKNRSDLVDESSDLIESQKRLMIALDSLEIRLRYYYRNETK